MKRFLRWCLWIGVGLVGLYLIAFVILSIQPPVSDSDLQHRRATIADNENGFGPLEQAYTAIWWPDAEQPALSDLALNTNWNPTLAATVLANNAKALQRLDAAVKMSELQVPEYQRQTDLLPYLEGWRRLAQLAVVRANAEFHAGQEAEAFRHALELVELGRRMQAAGGGQLQYLVGYGVKRLALSRMRDWAEHTHLPPKQLTDIIKELAQIPDDGEALAESLKVEYQVKIATLLDIREGRIVPGEDGSVNRQIRIKFLPVYNHGKTKRLFANTTRQLIQCAKVPYAQAQRPDFQRRPGPLKLILGGNVFGEVSYWLIMPGTEALIAARCDESVALQTTRMLLAARAYQSKHGRLPANLDALKPEFIAAVPEDAFSGEPLKYSREAKVIYSVGKDLRDDGGDLTKDTKRQPLDHGCEIKF